MGEKCGWIMLNPLAQIPGRVESCALSLCWYAESRRGVLGTIAGTSKIAKFRVCFNNLSLPPQKSINPTFYIIILFYGTTFFLVRVVVQQQTPRIYCGYMISWMKIKQQTQPGGRIAKIDIESGMPASWIFWIPISLASCKANQTFFVWVRNNSCGCRQI